MKKKDSEEQEYLRFVGDIEQNDKIDKPNFKICHGDAKIYQYFNFGQGPVYIEEKSAILRAFKLKYKSTTDNTQNGFIRIRFIVNCEGKAGRYRILQSDYNYQKMEFDQKIITQLIEITKGIENWQILYRKDIPIDYYMYFIFKITNGQLTEILP